MLSVQILRSSWVPKGLTYSVGRLFAGMGEAEEELSVAEWGQPPGLLQRPLLGVSDDAYAIPGHLLVILMN